MDLKNVGLRTLPRPRSGSAVVWTESPLQLLSAVEGHGAGLLGRDTTIYPRAGAVGMSGILSSMMSQVPAGVSFGQARTQIPSIRAAGVDKWVIGDAFSGQVQRQLLRHPPAHEVVVLDDGLATRKLLSGLTRDIPTPLLRPRAKRTPARDALGLAAWFRLRQLAQRGNLVVFTALPIDAQVHADFERLGGHLEFHRFEWLSTQPVTEIVNEPMIMVGSAMPADGLIHADPYINWVHELTEDGPVGYFPHRRETPELLARIAANPMIRMKEHTVPVEMRLRGLCPPQTVHCLPSTVLASLGLLLAPAGVRLQGQPVPPSWWTPTTTVQLRRHLSSSLDGLGSAA
ncbi:hypothetical protein [Arthrobacter monumenti]